MPYRITFVTSLFNGPKDLALSHKVLQILLNALYEADVAWLRAHPETPRLYTAGVNHKHRVRYEQEPLGQEDWKDIPSCLKDGYADCEDLACWRAAELTVKDGIPARPFFTWKVMANGSYLYHIKVRYADGREEDPSRKLGMGAHLFG